MSFNQVQYKTAKVESVDIFYREAGSPTSPGLLLLHGHASSSHTFRNLIPLLSPHFHIVAPDYPGFGQSSMPSPKDFTYTFANVASIINKYTESINFNKFFVYIFDYGAPVGMILATTHPDKILGIFTQSGNAYDDGLSPAFQGLRAWWADPSQTATPEHILGLEGIEGAYTHGVRPPSRVSPDAAALDKYYISRPGAKEVQLALLNDYQNVLPLYPGWQKYLRERKPKVVALWGRNDPFFTPPGAEAFKRDVPDADVGIVEEGAHFLNESHPQEVAAAVKKLLA